MSSGKKRVFVIDDHPMLREGVARLIDQQPDLCVMGESSSGAESLAKAIQADAVLLDVTLGREDGLHLLKQMRAMRPDLPVLVFSMHNEESFARRALHAGALGYLMKSAPPEKVIAGLRKVLEGHIALSPKMATLLLREALLNEPQTAADPIASVLSDREVHVFQLLGGGATPTTIAQALTVSVKTVEAHMANIKAKLGFETAAELRKEATEWVEGK